MDHCGYRRKSIFSNVAYQLKSQGPEALGNCLFVQREFFYGLVNRLIQQATDKNYHFLTGRRSHDLSDDPRTFQFSPFISQNICF